MKTEESKLEAQIQQLDIPVVSSSVMFTLDDMHKAYNAGMDRGSDVARAVVQQNDKLIKADDFITFMRKHYC
jgi:hypothetical protein